MENSERDGNTRPPACLLRNLYAGQEATIRTGHGTTDWFKIGKGVREGCILSRCSFNLHAEYIMRNARLVEAQAGIKIQFSSVQFSHSVVSNSLQPHELQHARPPCPSPTPGVHPNSMCIESVMASSHLILCHPLLLLPPIPPSIRVFSSESTLRMRYCGQSIGVSASASVLPMNTQD